MKKRPKIGQRAVWTSLDPSVQQTRGHIVEVSPNGSKVEIEWEDGETYSYNLDDPASCVRIVA